MKHALIIAILTTSLALAGCSDTPTLDLAPLFHDLDPHASEAYRSYVTISFAIADVDNENLTSGLLSLKMAADEGNAIWNEYRLQYLETFGQFTDWPEAPKPDYEAAGDFFAVAADIAEYGWDCREASWEGDECDWFSEDMDSFEDLRVEYAAAAGNWI